MKKISKILLLLFMITSILTLTACGEKNIEGSLEEIMAKVYEGYNSEIPEDERPMLMNIKVLEEVPDNIEYYIGTTDIEYEDILVSEPFNGSIAHSVVLVRMKDGANIEEAKTKIKENVNPRKWICVEVPEEDVIVENKGNLIILIMVADETAREKIDEGFDNL